MVHPGGRILASIVAHWIHWLVWGVACSCLWVVHIVWAVEHQGCQCGRYHCIWGATPCLQSYVASQELAAFAAPHALSDDAEGLTVLYMGACGIPKPS